MQSCHSDGRRNPPVPPTQAVFPLSIDDAMSQWKSQSPFDVVSLLRHNCTQPSRGFLAVNSHAMPISLHHVHWDWEHDEQKRFFDFSLGSGATLRSLRAKRYHDATFMIEIPPGEAYPSIQIKFIGVLRIVCDSDVRQRHWDQIENWRYYTRVASAPYDACSQRRERELLKKTKRPEKPPRHMHVVRFCPKAVFVHLEMFGSRQGGAMIWGRNGGGGVRLTP